MDATRADWAVRILAVDPALEASRTDALTALPLTSASRGVAVPPATSRKARLARETDVFRSETAVEWTLEARLELVGFVVVLGSGGGVNRSSWIGGRLSMLDCERTIVAGLASSPLTLTLLARVPRFAVPLPQRYSFHPRMVPLLLPPARTVASLRSVSPYTCAVMVSCIASLMRSVSPFSPSLCLRSLDRISASTVLSRFSRSMFDRPHSLTIFLSARSRSSARRRSAAI